MTDLASLADRLEQAEASHTACRLLSDDVPELTVDDAYGVQQLLIERRVSRGERLVGAKLGLTSKAKQERMGVDVPIFGWLTDAMQLAIEEPLDIATFIHPRAEPEIAFRFREELAGPGVDAHDVLDAADNVCAAMEIIDSRYADFRFTLPDVVADNTSAARFVLGGTSIPTGARDLSLLGVVLRVDGEVVATATGAAVLGHPAQSVALLANHLGREGRGIPAGTVVLAGAVTDAVPLQRGTSVKASFAGLGSISLTAQ